MPAADVASARSTGASAPSAVEGGSSSAGLAAGSLEHVCPLVAEQATSGFAPETT